MIFVKRTFEYLKRMAPALILALILPAVLSGLFTEVLSTVSFLPLYAKNKSGRFSDIFFMLISSERLYQIFPYILIGISAIICFSYGLGIMEKHLKTGKPGLANPLRSVNNTIMSVLKTLPIFCLALMALTVIQCGLVSLIHLICSGYGKAPNVFDMIWTGVFSAVLYVFAVMLALCFGVWAVIMQVYGYSFTDAFVEAMRTVSKKWFPLVLGLIIPLTLASAPQLVLNVLGLNHGILQIAMSTVIHLFIFVYFLAYITISMFELNGLERRDNKKAYPPEKGGKGK